jgi:EAL domain-containing protein (putative c-di-GMP-specific phosphodiesterase class I)
VGLEHAGERLTRIEFLFEAGLDYVKLDASVIQGVSQDAARAAFVQAPWACCMAWACRCMPKG